MKILQVRVNLHVQEKAAQNGVASVAVPVAVPDRTALLALAQQLHTSGQAFQGLVWGWPVHYDPEISQDAAEFQVPTSDGGYRIELRPFWSPASFTIGESGIWFFSLLWENGDAQPPVEFLDQQNVLAELQFDQALDPNGIEKANLQIA
jgi:hypothetical protein